MIHSSFETEYNKLNQQQKKAVDTIDGPVLVVAGPGSGKTQLLALRVVNILNQKDILPENILCLTFTDAASENMRERLRRFIGADAYRVGIYTFHSFGAEIIQQYGEYVPQYRDLTLIDPIETNEILTEILDGLTYDNPLRTMRAGEYSQLSDIKTAMGHLKKAGLPPEELHQILERNRKELQYLEPILVEASHLSLRKKEGWKQWEQVLADILTQDQKSVHDYFPSLTSQYIQIIQTRLNECEEMQKATPLSTFKTSYFEKDTQGNRRLKETRKTQKLGYLADVYQQYQQELEQRGLFDFSDMIVFAVQELKQNASLRSVIQNTYQYLLVDEFQDTNDAQMQMLYQLTRDIDCPNILAVGDDDQGIYRFQGAEVSNIIHFSKHFPGTQFVTLIHNYRSHQTVLDTARQLITQGQDRLENVLEDINKNLIAAGDVAAGDIILGQVHSVEEEYSWIAQKIQELIDTGHEPQEIAIISKKHQWLQDCIPYLIARDIPVEYDKAQDVLQQTHIHQLVTMARYIDSLRPGGSPRDDLLPEIISYPFWGISRLDIWEFFHHNGRSTGSWIERMKSSSHPSLPTIARIFQELAVAALSEPMERILYSLIGEKEGAVDGLMTPYKAYYFGHDELSQGSIEYISRLATLRQFIKTIKEYRSYAIILLNEALRVVDMYAIGGGIHSVDPFRSGRYGVQCMTAHKSKGLEFRTVFLLNVSQKGWASKGRTDTISFSTNLPIQPQKENLDDHLRLFFVALTRAKQNLYLVSHTWDEKGKEVKALGYLDFLPSQQIEGQRISENIQQAWDIDTGLTFSTAEHRFLESALMEYRMAPSHFNAFLDVRYGGPMSVLEQYILRMPRMSSPKAAYGNAFHKIIQTISQRVQEGRVIPEEAQLLELFEERLRKDRLSPMDHLRMMDKIQNILPLFLQQKSAEFYTQHHSEYSFGKFHMMVDQVPVTGAIDRIELFPEQGALTVVDFKTADPLQNWKDSNKQDKLDGYRRQLIFYALMVKQAGLIENLSTIEGRIDFLEPQNESFISLSMNITLEEQEVCTQLMNIVYHKIMSLDFPDISEYQKDNKTGQKRFIEDLFNGDI